MIGASQSDFSRLALEGAVIVVSILLAFALDAAWDKLEERTQADEYLAVLEAEFTDAMREMEGQITDHEKQLAIIEGMLNSIANNTDFATEDLIYLRGLFVYGPSHPVYDDLANSSSIDLLESAELRGELFRYGRLKDFLTILANNERNFFLTQMNPYLTQHIDLMLTNHASSPLGQDPKFESDWDHLRQDRQFHNLLVFRYGQVVMQLGIDRDIVDSIKNILANIEN